MRAARLKSTSPQKAHPPTQGRQSADLTADSLREARLHVGGTARADHLGGVTYMERLLRLETGGGEKSRGEG